jgi:hypothetical protein
LNEDAEEVDLLYPLHDISTDKPIEGLPESIGDLRLMESA